MLGVGRNVGSNLYSSILPDVKENGGGKIQGGKRRGEKAVSLTSDMWTSLHMDAYLAVTSFYK